MLGLIIAIVIFNFIAFKTNKRLSSSQIAHVWSFTIAFQNVFDLMVDVKYHGYWYFSKSIDWRALSAHTILLPPVIMMFLNWYPFHRPLGNHIRYFLYWLAGMLAYEMLTLLPQPWGYFYYGWWKLAYSAIVDPILLLILLGYYIRFIK